MQEKNLTLYCLSPNIPTSWLLSSSATEQGTGGERESNSKWHNTQCPAPHSPSISLSQRDLLSKTWAVTDTLLGHPGCRPLTTASGWLTSFVEIYPNLLGCSYSQVRDICRESQHDPFAKQEVTFISSSSFVVPPRSFLIQSLAYWIFSKKQRIKKNASKENQHNFWVFLLLLRLI